MMSFFGEIEEMVGELYPYRWWVLAAAVAVAAVAGRAAYRRGWHRTAGRHPRRIGVTLAVALVIGLPIGYVTLSPLWTRSELNEANPLAAVAAAATPAAGQDAAMAAAGFVPRVVSQGTFVGADEFHFGEGKAMLLETGPGEYTVRFEAFSVRNGPDLYVYLSPEPDDYRDDALNLGKLKATDGAFNYAVPAGTDITRYQSVVVWCRPFTVLFAFATLAPSG